MTSKPENDGVGRVANIEQAMELLEALSGHPTGLSQTELTAVLGLNKSAVSRILATLQRDGFISRNEESGRVRLGQKFIALALHHIDSLGLNELCDPILRIVAESTGELVQLAIVQDDAIHYVARVEGRNRIRVASVLGVNVPLHAFSAGKLWLAYLPVEKALSLALRSGKLAPLTNRTITDAATLQEQLKKIRADGFALNIEEADNGISSIAVPVLTFGHQKMIGAVSLIGPSYRLSEETLVGHLGALSKAAVELSRILPMVSLMN